MVFLNCSIGAKMLTFLHNKNLTDGSSNIGCKNLAAKELRSFK